MAPSFLAGASVQVSGCLLQRIAQRKRWKDDKAKAKRVQFCHSLSFLVSLRGGKGGTQCEIEVKDRLGWLTGWWCMYTRREEGWKRKRKRKRKKGGEFREEGGQRVWHRGCGEMQWRRQRRVIHVIGSSNHVLLLARYQDGTGNPVEEADHGP